MKYFKIIVVVAFLTFSLEFAHAKSLSLTVEPTYLQVRRPPPPPPRPPFGRHHRRHYRHHHRARIHIRLPKPPPPPPRPPRP